MAKKKTPGLFVPLPVDYYDDERMIMAAQVNTLCELLFTRLWARAKARERDGLVNVADLIAVRVPKAEKLMATLVEQKLLSVEPGGWRFVDWLDWNMSNDEIAIERKRIAGNVAKHRQTKPLSNHDVIDYTSDTNEDVIDYTSDTEGVTSVQVVSSKTDTDYVSTATEPAEPEPAPIQLDDMQRLAMRFGDLEDPKAFAWAVETSKAAKAARIAPGTLASAVIHAQTLAGASSTGSWPTPGRNPSVIVHVARILATGEVRPAEMTLRFNRWGGKERLQFGGWKAFADAWPTLTEDTPKVQSGGSITAKNEAVLEWGRSQMGLTHNLTEEVTA